MSVDKTSFFRKIVGFWGENAGFFMKLRPIAEKFDLGFTWIVLGFVLAHLGLFHFVEWQH